MAVRAAQTNAPFVLAIAIFLSVLGQRSSSMSHILCPEPDSHTITLNLARIRLPDLPETRLKSKLYAPDRSQILSYSILNKPKQRKLTALID